MSFTFPSQRGQGSPNNGTPNGPGFPSTDSRGGEAEASIFVPDSDAIWVDYSVLDDGYSPIRVNSAVLVLLGECLQVRVPSTRFSSSVFYRDIHTVDANTESGEIILTGGLSGNRRQYIIRLNDTSLAQNIFRIIKTRVGVLGWSPLVTFEGSDATTAQLKSGLNLQFSNATDSRSPMRSGDRRKELSASPNIRFKSDVELLAHSAAISHNPEGIHYTLLSPELSTGNENNRRSSLERFEHRHGKNWEDTDARMGDINSPSGGSSAMSRGVSGRPNTAQSPSTVDFFYGDGGWNRKAAPKVTFENSQSPSTVREGSVGDGYLRAHQRIHSFQPAPAPPGRNVDEVLEVVFQSPQKKDSANHASTRQQYVPFDPTTYEAQRPQRNQSEQRAASEVPVVSALVSPEAPLWLLRRDQNEKLVHERLYHEERQSQAPRHRGQYEMGPESDFAPVEPRAAPSWKQNANRQPSSHLPHAYSVASEDYTGYVVRSRASTGPSASHEPTQQRYANEFVFTEPPPMMLRRASSPSLRRGQSAPGQSNSSQSQPPLSVSVNISGSSPTPLAPSPITRPATQSASASRFEDDRALLGTPTQGQQPSTSTPAAEASAGRQQQNPNPVRSDEGRRNGAPYQTATGGEVTQITHLPPPSAANTAVGQERPAAAPASRSENSQPTTSVVAPPPSGNRPKYYYIVPEDDDEVQRRSPPAPAAPTGDRPPPSHLQSRPSQGSDASTVRSPEDRALVVRAPPSSRPHQGSTPPAGNPSPPQEQLRAEESQPPAPAAAGQKGPAPAKRPPPPPPAYGETQQQQKQGPPPPAARLEPVEANPPPQRQSNPNSDVASTPDARPVAPNKRQQVFRDPPRSQQQQ